MYGLWTKCSEQHYEREMITWNNLRITDKFTWNNVFFFSFLFTVSSTLLIKNTFLNTFFFASSLSLLVGHSYTGSVSYAPIRLHSFLRTLIPDDYFSCKWYLNWEAFVRSLEEKEKTWFGKNGNFKEKYTCGWFETFAYRMHPQFFTFRCLLF